MHYKLTILQHKIKFFKKIKTPEETLDTKRTLRKITFLVDKFLDFPFLEKNEWGSMIQT